MMHIKPTTTETIGQSLTRRSFLKRSAATAGVLSVAPFNILTAANAGDQIRCVQIGCGSRGMSHLNAVLKENIVALVDVDEKRHAVAKKLLQGKNHDPEKIKTFTDYRRMFDALGKDFDAVFIASPNHHHALPSLIAMQLGKHVYCEKPVCHDIGEARAMRAMAARTKVATQMGTQGHCEDGYRKLCEYIWSGVIGKVTETHSWTDRSNGGVGPRPPTEPVPEGMNWDAWIGPAPYRDFHGDLHPHEWHGWYDFGNGSIGNMGCHVLDGVYWALKVQHPTSIEVEQLRGGSDERYPTGSRVRWDIPARGEMPALKAYWYEGLNPSTQGAADGVLRTAKGANRYLPQHLLELIKKYPDEELDSGDSGSIYIGEKGVIYTGTYGNRMHLVPYAKMKETPEPPQMLPRPKGVFVDFLDAIRAGKTETASNFDYGTQLTEFVLLANLAMHAGAGNKVMWDGPGMKVTNIPELNAWVTRKNRAGWNA
ncbi:MAG: Gfo/Idh/MocA family oxidoreductase [Verrucomicrobiae bacterium]|nr:Gfo/Idh/MocA family oxidoreductase [Verrucomicrobiae bacterium]